MGTLRRCLPRSGALVAGWAVRRGVLGSGWGLFSEGWRGAADTKVDRRRCREGKRRFRDRGRWDGQTVEV